MKKFVIGLMLFGILTAAPSLTYGQAEPAGEVEGLSRLQAVIDGLKKLIEDLQARLERLTAGRQEQNAIQEQNAVDRTQNAAEPAANAVAPVVPGVPGWNAVNGDKKVVPAACPRLLTRPLVKGERSREVVALQWVLKATGDFAHPEATGYFGDITEEALKKFLARETLTEVTNTRPTLVPGEAFDEPTVRKINEYYCYKYRAEQPKPDVIMDVIDVFSPQGGEVWQIGGTYKIGYRAHVKSNDTLFKIGIGRPLPGADSFKPGVTAYMRIGQTADPESFVFTVPASLADWPGTGVYRVEVCSKSACGLSGEIKIVGPSGQLVPEPRPYKFKADPGYGRGGGQTSASEVKVVSPNGGEKWEVGRSYDILYQVNLGANAADLPVVEIYLQKHHPAGGPKTGVNSSLLIAETKDQTKFTYVVPAIIWTWPGAGETYKIKVCGGQTCDESDGFFTIVPFSGGNSSFKPKVDLVDLKVNDSDEPAAVPLGSEIVVSWSFSGGDRCRPFGYHVPTSDGRLWTQLNDLPPVGKVQLIARHANFERISLLDLGMQCWDKDQNSFTDRIEVPIL